MPRPRAFVCLQPPPHYGGTAIRAGLAACGHEIIERPVRIGTPQPNDVLLIWNRYGSSAVWAERFEAVGAPVIVAENGMIGAWANEYAKPFTASGEQLYSLSLNFHNGAGRWHIGAAGRWREQGIRVQPWREEDDDGRGHVLLFGQRGFGHPRVAPPPAWLENTAAKLKRLTHRPIRIRAHPGNEPAKVPLEHDLADAWCAVTWGSAAGIKAMCAGVPCYSDWSGWLGFPGALPLGEIGTVDERDADVARETMLDRIAWHQWSTSEIAEGEPFKRLLALHRAQRQAA